MKRFLISGLILILVATLHATPAETLTTAQTQLGAGDKGAAIATLAAAIPELDEGDEDADNLLAWAIPQLRGEKALRAVALGKLDLNQATRLSETAYNQGDWRTRKLYLERYRELGGTNGPMLLALGWAQALTDNDDRAALVTYRAIAGDEEMGSQWREAAALMEDALTTPTSMASLEKVEALFADRVAYSGSTARVEAAARRYSFACTQSFYQEMLADNGVSTSAKAGHEAKRVEFLYAARRFEECVTAAQGLLLYEDDAVDIGLLYMGLAEYRLGQYDTAIESLLDFVGDHGEHARVPEAMLHAGLAMIQNHDRPSAFSEFTILAEEFPESPEADIAQSHLDRWETYPDFPEVSQQAMLVIPSLRERQMAKAKSGPAPRQMMGQGTIKPASIQVAPPPATTKTASLSKGDASPVSPSAEAND